MRYSYSVAQGVKVTKTNFKKYVAGAAIAVLGASAIAIPALAASFTNGSFETGTDPGSFSTLTAPDATTIPGWTVSAGTIDYIGTYWQASDGTRSLDLSGNGPGAISQTFSTVTGRHYVVTFDMAGNPDGAPAIKTMTVNATGGPTTPYTFDVTGHDKTNMGWQSQIYSFTATGASTTLTFTSTTATAFGPALDNVVVSRLNTVTITNHNHVHITNTNTQTATTGSATVSNNTTGGSATSGGASNTNSTTNTVTTTNNP